MSIVFVTDAQIRVLNKKFHHADNATDVLTFDLGVEADVVISADTAIRNAKVFKTTPEYELYLYVIHGILHLLGYNDAAKAQRARMQKIAETILSQLSWLRHAHP